ncbi:MAG: BON domain-containing protein [Alphaproteobacteria bacterium]
MAKMPVVLAAVAALGILALAAPGAAAFGLLDIISAPKTLFDRAIEARSTSDIVEDNKIVLAVNGIMADLGTIKASTEIYEQRLLITGMFDDKKLYDKFLAEVKKVKGVKKLYWHVVHMSKEDQEKNKEKLIDWGDALVLDTKVGLKLVGTGDVADVNYRVAADAQSTVYLIGRARSQAEMKLAVKVARGAEGVKKLINYVEVRP